MATATITLTLASPTEGSAWEVEFTADDATAINTITGFSISATTPSLPSLFTVSSVNGYGAQYVTWRSTSPAGQHPSSGLSMDIWNQKFYQNIMDNNRTWTEMLTNGDSGATYNLNSAKYSLIYNYSQLYAPIYSKGGTLTVAVA